MALQGDPVLQIILDRTSVLQAQQDFEAALKRAAPKAVSDLVRRGAVYLHDLEEGLGHHGLADLWTYTNVTTNPDGSAEAEVFSHAESMQFYNDTGQTYGGIDDRVKSETHFVEGEDLLAYLEYGVKPHRITVTGDAAHGKLAFPIAEGYKQSDFIGTAATSGGVVAGLFGGLEPDTKFVGDSVMHPGFAGNHNILNTYLMLERSLDAVIRTTGNQIAATFDRR